MNEVRRYLNPVAAMHLASKATYKVLIAGRAFSKSFLNGLEIAERVETMPRSKGLFASPTYAMIYVNTLLPMKAAWEQHMGYIEGVHYVVGIKPPAHFAKPWHRPTKYENVVTFWNGTTVVYGSWDRPGSMSGGSNDWFIDDEAYMHDKDPMDLFVIPTLRGTHTSFQKQPKHLQRSFTSSMPFRGQGDWLMDFRLKAKLFPYRENKADDPTYISYSFIGWEPNEKIQLGSTWFNVNVIGRKAILAMKAEMTKLSYRLMVLNQQVTNWGDTFYPGLASRHWYTPEANEKLIAVPLAALNKFKRDATFDVGPDDYDPDMPLHISHDWGKFNCITIDQQHAKEVRFINAMHAFNQSDDDDGNGKTQDDLADDFCDYYESHACRIVYQWGDKAGNSKTGQAKQSAFKQFAEKLRARGWQVVQKKTGDIDTLDRFRFISKLHNEEDPKLPKVRHNSRLKDFRIALEAAGMKDDKKDKSSERNKAIKPEHATHYTDAYDYRLYWGFVHLEKKDAGLALYGSSITQ